MIVFACAWVGSFLAVADPGLVEKVSVRVAEVSFTAVDRDGNPVLDLTDAEVEVVEDGKPRPLRSLQRVAEESLGEIDPRETEATASAGAPRPGRWIVFLFDRLLASPRTRNRAVEGVRTLLLSELREGDRAAIAVFNGELSLVQGFTSDSGKLLTALERVGEVEPPAGRERARALDDLARELKSCDELGSLAPDPASKIRCADTVIGAWQDERRREVDRFFTAALLLVRSVAPVPFQKRLVLLSDGFARRSDQDAAIFAEAAIGGLRVSDVASLRGRHDSDARFEDLAREAADARVAIYAIQAGLWMKVGTSAAEGSAPSLAALALDPWKSSFLNASDALRELADSTGGAYLREGDLEKGLHEVASLWQGLYVATYERGEGDPERPRRIEIRVRREGVAAGARRTLSGEAPLPPLTAELDASAGACDETDRRRLTVKVVVPRAALRSTDLGDRSVSNFALYLRVFDAGGRVPPFEDYRFLHVDTATQGKAEDPAVERTLVVPCIPLTVAARVVDAETGAARDLSAAVGYASPSGSSENTDPQ